MSKARISPKGSSWSELEKQLFTPKEIAESVVRVAIINQLQLNHVKKETHRYSEK